MYSLLPLSLPRPPAEGLSGDRSREEVHLVTELLSSRGKYAKLPRYVSFVPPTRHFRCNSLGECAAVDQLSVRAFARVTMYFRCLIANYK